MGRCLLGEDTCYILKGIMLHNHGNTNLMGTQTLWEHLCIGTKIFLSVEIAILVIHTLQYLRTWYRYIPSLPIETCIAIKIAIYVGLLVVNTCI